MPRCPVADQDFAHESPTQLRHNAVELSQASRSGATAIASLEISIGAVARIFGVIADISEFGVAGGRDRATRRNVSGTLAIARVGEPLCSKNRGETDPDP